MSSSHESPILEPQPENPNLKWKKKIEVLYDPDAPHNVENSIAAEISTGSLNTWPAAAKTIVSRMFNILEIMKKRQLILDADFAVVMPKILKLIDEVGELYQQYPDSTREPSENEKKIIIDKSKILAKEIVDRSNGTYIEPTHEDSLQD